jgi:hypothetical protein
MNRELKNLEEWWPNIPRKDNLLKNRGKKQKLTSNLNKDSTFKSPLPIGKK